MVTLTYSISETDFMRAARVLWSYQAIGDRGNWILTGICATAGLALLGSNYWTGWIWIGAAGMLMAITLLRNHLWRRGYQKMVKYTAPITATFSQDSIETHSAEGSSTLPWSTFQKYAETPDYFFVFMGWRSFSILPKSAIANEQDLDTLRDLIAANLPRAKMRWT